MNKSTSISITRSIAILATSKLFSLLKISFAIGTFWTAFSLRTMLTPLIGAFGGGIGIGLMCASSAAYALFFKKAVALSYLAYSGIPTVCASLYWATESRMARAFIPVLCMVLFLLHPQGMLAAPYALFWLIPIIIAHLKNSSVFLTAVGSTFTAHAVGSVLWLYSTGMGATYWYSLLPLVPAERLLLAVGMSASYMIFTYLFSYSFGFLFGQTRAQ